MPDPLDVEQTLESVADRNMASFISECDIQGLSYVRKSEEDFEVYVAYELTVEDRKLVVYMPGCSFMEELKAHPSSEPEPARILVREKDKSSWYWGICVGCCAKRVDSNCWNFR